MTSQLELKCEIAEARRAAESVRNFLVSEGCEESDTVDCVLAVVEACNNAIQYATAEGRLQSVLVQMTCLPDRVELRVTDHTPGFDWPAKAPLPSPSSERGRGIFLMQAVMDFTEYLRGTTENTLVLVRKRACRPLTV